MARVVNRFCFINKIVPRLKEIGVLLEALGGDLTNDVNPEIYYLVQSKRGGLFIKYRPTICEVITKFDDEYSTWIEEIIFFVRGQKHLELAKKIADIYETALPSGVQLTIKIVQESG